MASPRGGALVPHKEEHGPCRRRPERESVQLLQLTGLGGRDRRCDRAGKGGRAAVGQNVRLGRVAGIPVGANWSVAVILVIIADILAVSVLPADVPHRPAALYWLVAVVAAALFLACLLAHELARASGSPQRCRRALDHAVDASRWPMS
jgi:hypothetical protein